MPCGAWKVGHPARRSAQSPSGTASRRSESRERWIGRRPQMQQVEKYRFCSHILQMTEATPRRTEALKLRQTISLLLDQIFAIEQLMEIFHRKDDPGELERAVENFNEMLGSVDRLGELIADARAKHATPDALPDRAA
jgi:hypothetical protein